MFVEFVSVH